MNVHVAEIDLSPTRLRFLPRGYRPFSALHDVLYGPLITFQGQKDLAAKYALDDGKGDLFPLL